MKSSLDAEDLYLQLLAQIKNQTAHIQKLAIVGIYSGGAWLAQRLATDLGMDDALGYTDPNRLRLMGAVLATAAKDCQIVIFTCVPERYSNIGAATLPVAADFVAYSANFDTTSSVHLQRAVDGKLSLSIDHA
ncbi:MAG: hypothetical protein NTY70_07615 [Burkholderiales bacterium]|nr:hypothetical protein [Burkholderiales bacterium]